MKIRIWGARGSVPSPLKPPAIEEKIVQAILQMPLLDTTDETAVKTYVNSLPPLLRGTAGGNTACVEIMAGEDVFIVDAGSGIRDLGAHLMRGACGSSGCNIHIFFSHPHWDHIQGFPFFAPAFNPNNRLFLYSIHNLENALSDQQRPLTFPVSLDYMRATREFISIKAGEPFSVGPLTINTIANAHPGVAYSFRIEDKNSCFVYASDAEYKNLDEDSIRPYLNFFKNSDLLLFDAQYTLKEAWQKVDWGHSSAMIGVDMARASGTKRLLLFHHDPTYSDMDLLQIQKTASAYQAQDSTLSPCDIIVAYEGLTIDLTPSGNVDLQIMADQDAAVLTPSSAFTQQSVEQLEKKLEQLDEQGSAAPPIIDLSQIETLTVAGLKALLALHRKKGGSQIVLANPSESTQAVIKLSGYQNIFAMYDSVDDALTAVQIRETLNLPGQIVDNRYRIEQKMGASPLGALLKATDTASNRQVALKILSPFFSDETINKFLGHIQAIVKLAHPSINQVVGGAKTDHYTYHAERFIDGNPLQSVLDESTTPIPLTEAMKIVCQTTDALAFAHSHDVIHGDLKPQNIFLTAKGIKITGFGFGHLDEGNDLTRAPLLLLSVPYLAPEQILGQTIDQRTDLYALGVLMYQLLTGTLPFTGTDQQVIRAHLKLSPPSPRVANPKISVTLNHVVRKLLAKNPDDRYQSARELQSILTSINTDTPTNKLVSEQPLILHPAEMKKLQTCWNRTSAGKGQVVMLSGATGIGKSTLLHQFADQIESSILLWGNNDNYEINRPYAPFSQILNRYIFEHPTILDDTETCALVANFMAILNPDSKILSRCIAPPMQNNIDEAKRFFDSLIDFLDKETQKEPWFLVFDDLHRADRATLDLLRLIISRLPAMRLMIVGIYNETSDSVERPLQRFLKHLSQTETHVQHIELTGISQPNVARILSKLLNLEIPPRWVKKIHRHSKGNPLYVEEIAYGLVDDGYFQRQNLQNGYIPSAANVRLPDDIRESVWRRLHHLDPDTQTLLRQTAVWGQNFKLSNLEIVSGLSDDELLAQLDAALVRKLVFETQESGVFAHKHSEIQQVLYIDIGVARRRILHRQIATALEQLPQASVWAAPLAYHFKEADLPEKAIPYSIKAAEQAVAMRAPKLALQWYNQTMDMLSQLSPETINNFQSYQNSTHRALGQVLTQFQEFDEVLESLIQKQ